MARKGELMTDCSSKTLSSFAAKLRFEELPESVYDLNPEAIARVAAHVHQGAIDVLGPVVNPQTVHQSKFSMGTVLAIVALFRRAGVKEFEAHFNDPRVVAFREKVDMIPDLEVDQAYPLRWIGKVTVKTADGRILFGQIDEPKGDPGNTLTRNELEEKALQLAQFSGAANEAEMRPIFDRIWDITRIDKIESFFDSGGKVP
jgi:2-methylcitrate dehydratase PrpD